MKKNDQVYLRFAFAVLIAFAIPDSAFAYGPALQPGTVFDGITNTFKNSSAGWMNSAQGYAQHLFFGLAGIEFAWAAGQLLLKKGELNDMIASVFLKVLGIGFFYSLLMMAPTWLPQIMDSFGQAGAGVSSSGGSAAMLSPSAIFDQGLGVAGTMVSAMNSANSGNLSLGNVVSSGGASIGGFLFGAIVTGLSGLITIIAFTIVAVQLMVTLIESYVVIGGGMLMLGFLGSRWTLPFGEKYFGYAVSTGIKLFTLYLIVGEGQNVANQIIHTLTAGGATPGPVDFMGAGASSLAYGAMGYMVPAMAGSMMNGSPSLSMGNMAAAGGGIAGSMIGAAATIGSAALSGASAAIGAFNKTTAAAGNIGGEMTPGAAGGIGGTLADSAGTVKSGSAAGFGDGISSRVDAPPGLAAGTTGSAGVSAAGQAQPTPAPAALAAESSKTAPDALTTGGSNDGAAQVADAAVPAAGGADNAGMNQAQASPAAAQAEAGGGKATPLTARFDQAQPQAGDSQSAATQLTQAQSAGGTSDGAAQAENAAVHAARGAGNAGVDQAQASLAAAQAADTTALSQTTPATQTAAADAAATPAQSEVSKNDAAPKSAPGVKPAAGDNSSYAKNLSTSQVVESKGSTDAVVDKKKTSIDLAKKAESLNDMARRMDRLPVNDGHTGGISIKLNHLE